MGPPQPGKRLREFGTSLKTCVLAILYLGWGGGALEYGNVGEIFRIKCLFRKMLVFLQGYPTKDETFNYRPETLANTI